MTTIKNVEPNALIVDGAAAAAAGSSSGYPFLQIPRESWMQILSLVLSIFLRFDFSLLFGQTLNIFIGVRRGT